MRRMTKTLLALVAGLALFGAVACEDGPPSEKQEQSEKNANVYEQILANQEVSDPTYSNDLENIDFWVDTWGSDPGALAYVYLLSSDGDFIGYYILKGLPTTKCKNATPTYEIIYDEYGGNVVVPAPGLSATYGTGSGDCTTFYGQDASTGAYVEWTVTEMTMLTFNQQYTLPEGVTPPALGFTEFDEVEPTE